MYKVLIFLFLFCGLRIMSFSQEKVIINRGVDTLYANSFQLFVIEIPQRDSAEIIVEPSQGIVNSMDDSRPEAELLNICNLKKGKVLVKVYKLIAKEKIFLGKRIFPVIIKPLTIEEKNYSDLKPKPIITLCGKLRGFILIDSIKKVRELFISPPFKLKSATVYFGDHDVTTASLNSSNLSPLHELFSRCQNGTMITFSQIRIIKNNKIYEVPDTSFRIK